MADKSQSVIARLTAKLGKAGVEALAEGMSNNELHQKLNRALRSVVPAFYGVEDIFMESSTAIYVSMPGDSLEFWECAFTVGENSEVTLGRRKQVEPVTEWKKVAKADASADAQEAALASIEHNLERVLNSGCKCHEATDDNPAVVGEPPVEGKGVTMSDKATEKATEKVVEPTAAAVALAGRLIANSATPFTEEDKDQLVGWGEARLGAFEQWLADAEPAPVTDPNKVEVSKDELANLRRMAAREEARDKQHRAQLVATLLATGRKGFDEKALNAKSTDELEALREFAGIDEEPSYVGQGNFAASRPEGSIDDYMPPDPWKTKDLSLLKSLGYRAAS